MPRGSRPGERRGGRVAGTPNKFNADLRAMILGALDAAGGENYLARCATENPVAFMGLLGKVLPLQVSGEEGRPLAIDFRWADAVQSPTLEPEVLAAAGAAEFAVVWADDAEAEPS